MLNCPAPGRRVPCVAHTLNQDMMASLGLIVNAAQRSLDAVALSFSPPATSTSRTIRWNGLICLLIGLVCIVTGGLLIAVSHAPPTLAMMPVMLAYAFFTVGGYRLIRGKEPAPAHSAEISFSRIFIGCFSVVFCVALLLGLVKIASFLFEK